MIKLRTTKTWHSEDIVKTVNELHYSQCIPDFLLQMKIYSSEQ